AAVRASLTASRQSVARRPDHSKVGHATCENSIAPAVARYLVAADVESVTLDFLRFRVGGGVQNANHHPVTAKALAERATDTLETRLDFRLRESGAAHV